MLSNIELKKKVDKITNKLKAGLFHEVNLDPKVLLKKTKHPILFNILSLAFQSKGEFNNSVEIMNDALQLSPRNVLHLNNLAFNLFVILSTFFFNSIFDNIYFIFPITLRLEFCLISLIVFLIFIIITFFLGP